MATADVRKVLRIPGKLYADPTDLSAAAPFGGTALGMTRTAIFRPQLSHHAVKAEEFGGEPVEYFYGGEVAIFGAFLRGLDNDAVEKIFLNSSVGSSSGDRVVDYPGTNRAGTLGSSREFKLLFAPKDTRNHPALLIYRALPLVEEAAELNWNLSVELDVAVMFAGIRTASGNIYQIGRMEDLTLSG